MEPTWTQLGWQTVAAFMTLAIFSFLVGDNPVYKFAERLWVGISTGYWTMLLYHTSFTDKVLTPIFSEGQLVYLIPTMMGLTMWLRLFPKFAWVSRFAMAFYIGISTGLFIPLAFKTSIFLQAEGSIRPIEASGAGVVQLLVLVGLICSLVYFFFSKAHTGVLGGMSKVGIYTLMIGFGAGFALTVMGRVALLVNRVIFLKGYFPNLWGKLF